MIELDNTMLLFIGSENYSGTKISRTEWSVPVRIWSGHKGKCMTYVIDSPDVSTVHKIR